jgi:hypothetical protein
MKFNSDTGMLEEGKSPLENLEFPKEAYSQSEVSIVNNLGESLTIKPDSIQDAITAGYRYESPAQKQERLLDEKYGTRPFAAAALGGASALTFGLSDLGNRFLGTKDSIEAAREIKKRNSAYSMIGEVGGTLLPAIASFGGSLFAKSAAKALASRAESGAIKQASQLELGFIKGLVGEAEESTAKIAARQAGLGENLSRGILTGISDYTAPALVDKAAKALAGKLAKTGFGQAIVRGAAEGGLTGVGQSISQLALSENDLTPEYVAESLISNAGLGAFLGAGVGGGFYSVGKGAEKISNSISKWAKGKTGGTGSLVGDAMESSYGDIFTEKVNSDEIRAIAKRMGVKDEDIAVQFLLSDEKAAAGVVEAGKRSTYGGYNFHKKSNNFREALKDYSMGLMDKLPNVSFENAGAFARESIIDKAQMELNGLSSEWDELTKHLGKIEVKDKWIKRAYEDIKEISGFKFEKDLKETLKYGMDRIKNVDDIKKLRTQLFAMAKEASAYPKQNANLARVMYEVRDQLQELDWKSTMKAAFKNAPNEKEALKLMDEMLRKRLELNAKTFALNSKYQKVFGDEGTKLIKGRSGLREIIEKMQKLSPDEVSKKLFNYKKGNLELFASQFPREALKLKQAYLSNLRYEVYRDGHFDVGKFVRFMKSEGLRGIQMSKDTQKFIFGNAGYRKVQDIVKLYESHPKEFINYSNTASSLVNSLSLNVLNQAHDLALYAAHYKELPLIFGTVKFSEEAISGKLSSIVKGGFERSKSAMTKGATVIANDMTQKDYDKRLNSLAEMASSPAKLEEHLAKVTEQFGDNEALTEMLQGKVIAAQSFLLEKAPKSNIHEPYGAQKQYKPSDQELARWNRYIRAVDNPLTILEDMRGGILTPESVEAVKAIYPQLYEKIVMKANEHLAKSKKPLSIQAKIQVATLMGVPVSSALSPQLMKILQSNTQQATNQAKATNKQFGMSERTRSSTNALLSR